MSFKDHFSDASTAYRDARPTYPPALFEWLASLAPSRERAWDCACGNGQASVPLASHFREVIATDASAEQIGAASPHERVTYRVAPAEDSGLPAASVDLVTVAQAAHWLDHSRFHAEVDRVLRPGGVLAYVSYGHFHASPEFDEVVRHYYTDVVGPFWPPERIHVENGYRDIPFPYSRIEPPGLAMELEWDLERVLAYLATWSASKAYFKRHGQDPLGTIERDASGAWGDPVAVRRVSWPLTVLAGRKP